jgi:ADP-heptose:LPS heptosyltransferase
MNNNRPLFASTSAPANICLVSFARMGDTVCKLPALWAIRDAYPKARICLVSQAERSAAFVASHEVLKGTGLVDSFETVTVQGPKLTQWGNRLRVVARMRRTKWDLGIALMPNYPPADMAVFRTLRRYLRYFGCSGIFGPEEVVGFRRSNGRLEPLPHVADNMLASLQGLGIAIPPPHKGKFVMPIREEEAAWARDFAARHFHPQASGLIAVATLANRPANIWPIGRYMEVLKRLWLKRRLIPVFFGGSDLGRTLGHYLPPSLPHVVCAGETVARASELARLCSIYLGNDTGLMHLAVAVGLKCVAVASARDAPGAWAPYGEGHVVLRSEVECEGCLLDACIEQKTNVSV